MNNKFPHVEETKVQKYERYLPTAFDSSLSIIEKVNKLIEHVNKFAVEFNGIIDLANNIDQMVAMKENSIDITNKRKLSPTGNFTGTLQGKKIDEVFAWIDSNTDKLNTLTWQFADGYTGQVIDSGFFESTNIRRNYDGGIF